MARGSPGETVDRRLRSDPLGRRVETIEYVDAATGQVMDGVGANPSPRRTRHVYFGLELIQEYSCGADGTTPPVSGAWPCETSMPLVREFFHGAPERYPEAVAMIRHNPDTQDQWAYHYLHDVLGSVIGLVDEAGQLVERYTYDPYGKVFIEKWQTDGQGGGGWLASAEPNSGMPYSPTGNPFMWTGHRYDASVGLYHTLFRTYSPTMGRWLQRDPIEYEGGSINLYEYASSSPLEWSDPLGLMCQPLDNKKDCLTRAEDKTNQEIGDLKNEGYYPESNDQKILHCLNSCNVQKMCFGGSDTNPRSKVVGGAANFIGGILYEVQTAIGFKLRVGHTKQKGNAGGQDGRAGRYGSNDDLVKKIEPFDGQHPLMWAIDTPGDIVANAMGIAAGMAGKDCKQACKAAHAIPGPNYSRRHGGVRTGQLVPLLLREFRFLYLSKE